MSLPIGLDDRDGWREYWQSLHHSELFDGELARLAIRQLMAPEDDGAGYELLRYVEDDRRIEARVDFVIETHSLEDRTVRVFHVVSIVSPGDPMPPWVIDS